MAGLGTKRVRFTRQVMLRYLYAGITLLVILSLIPSSQKFGYDYTLGKPWKYDDLIADFSFSVLKSDDQLQNERQAIIASFEPFYKVDTTIEIRALKNFEELLLENAESLEDAPSKRKMKQYQNAGSKVIKKLYQDGIIQLTSEHRNQESLKIIRVLSGKNERGVSLSRLHQLGQLKEGIDAHVLAYSKLNFDLLKTSILGSLRPNLVYEQELSDNDLDERLQAISPSAGSVESGELIIRKGVKITELEYRKLESLKSQYRDLVRADGFGLHLTGYIILIVVVFLIYIGYIQLFQIQLIQRNRRLLLLLINIVLFVFLTRYTLVNEELNVFVIPFCIVPIVTLAFFDYKLALITHIVVVLIVGAFITTNEAKFIIIQLIAGFTAILSMIRLQYLSQFFISSLVILAGYVLSYFAFELTEINSIADIRTKDYLWLLGNFILTLLAYPLIYAYEKIFGFVSDITLVELSDVNKKLLRKLSIEAPGTFQHSLQVANLSESVINEIGGKALLTRVGALYHDIGKMKNPEYFIENQRFIDNPHDALSDEESAQMIISHVTEGVQMAKQNGLPQVIVDFVRTHHGESRVEYFYRNYLKKVPANEIDETKFRYPGPKPATREMAVVMVCDSIEAATRSLQDKNAESIARMIDGIIDSKINDKQLQAAPITLSEIEIMRELLKERIKSMYHVRVEYPDAPSAE